MLSKLEQSVSSAEAARKTTDAYIEAINQRSSLILQYNERLASIRKLSAEHDDLARRQEQLGQKLLAGTTDVLQPEIVAWMSRAYEMTRTNVLQMCYWLGRAYSFTLLKEPPVDLGSLLKLDPRGFNSKTIDALLTAYQRQGEIDLSVPEVFPHDPADVINGGKGRYLLFDSPQVLDRFRDKGSLVFTLGPDKTPLFSGAVSPFESHVNVRIAAVCVWLEGLDLDPGQQISILVTRDGSAGDTFVAANGDRHVFTHGPLKSLFEYSIQADSEGETRMQAIPATLSSPQFDYTKKAFAVGDYAMPGPFGVWKIEINADGCVDTTSDQRAPLDMEEILKNLEAIRVEFIGLWQATTA